MKTTKTVFHIFDASAFDEELGLLNEMSEKGWQLQDMRILSQKYIWDDNVVYRYAIDYQHDLSLGEFKQYRAEFEDQDWKYVTNKGCWYVFRKPYDPTLPEEEYLLYTDEPSFRDMKRSVVLKVNVAGIFILPNYIMTPHLPFFLQAAALLFVGIDGIFRRRRLNRVRCLPKKYRFHLWRYTYVLAILLFVLSVVFLFARDSTWDAQTPVPAVGVQSVDFAVKIPDFYGIYADSFKPDASKVPYTITDKDGRLVSSGVLSIAWDERTNCFFWPGVYTMTVDWGEGPDWTERQAGIGYPNSLLPEMPWWATLVWIFGWGGVFTVLEIISKQKHGHPTWI